jgi:HlyD family secretion protein
MRQIGVVLVSTVVVLATAGCSDTPSTVWQGYVEGEFVNIAASQSGQLEQLAVTRGQTITVGTPLFRLESGDEVAARKQFEDQLEASQAQLEDIKTGKRLPEQAVTKAQLLQAQINAQHAAAQAKRFALLFPSGGISKQELEDAQNTANVADAQVRQLQSAVQVDLLPDRDGQIHAQEALVAAAQAALAQADWKLAQKALTAPRAGLVFDTLYREGEWVAQGSPVLRMLPPENIKVRFFVPEPVLGKLKVGQSVSLHCDGCAADVTAQISYISTAAEYTPPIIYSNENRAKLVYLIEAHPSKTDAPKLHPGQPLDVRLS